MFLCETPILEYISQIQLCINYWIITHTTSMSTLPCNNCDIVSQFFVFQIMPSQEYKCIYVVFSIMYFLNHSISICMEFHKEHYFVVYSMPWFQEVVLKTNIMQFCKYILCTYFLGFHENSCSFHSPSLNNVFTCNGKELWISSPCKKNCANKQMISYFFSCLQQLIRFDQSFIIS